MKTFFISYRTGNGTRSVARIWRVAPAAYGGGGSPPSSQAHLNLIARCTASTKYKARFALFDMFDMFSMLSVPVESARRMP
jgi:hypothetical protein